jgi:hypothetical protein
MAAPLKKSRRLIVLFIFRHGSSFPFGYLMMVMDL